MTLPAFDHLFDQAERLIVLSPRGAPRQTDLRRSVSTNYYCIFHALLAAAADELIGRSQRATALYALVYRSVDHGTIKQVCPDVAKPTLPQRYLPFVPVGGFGHDIQRLALLTVGAQAKRHLADYDPLTRFDAVDARTAISNARGAVSRLQRAEGGLRRVFLTLLLFPPRPAAA